VINRVEESEGGYEFVVQLASGKLVGKNIAAGAYKRRP